MSVSSQNFRGLFWTQFAIIVANFIISSFVVHKWHSFEYKTRFLNCAEKNQTTTNFQAYSKNSTRLKCRQKHQVFIAKTSTTQFTKKFYGVSRLSL